MNKSPMTVVQSLFSILSLPVRACGRCQQGSSTGAEFSIYFPPKKEGDDETNALALLSLYTRLHRQQNQGNFPAYQHVFICQSCVREQLLWIFQDEEGIEQLVEKLLNHASSGSDGRWIAVLAQLDLEDLELTNRLFLLSSKKSKTLAEIFQQAQDIRLSDGVYFDLLDDKNA